MRNAIITGTGSYVPSHVVRNEEFPLALETSDAWIRTRTGIRERRFAGPGESSVSMGVAASRAALEAAGLSPADIELIIFATVTPDAMVPCNGCRLQAELGCGPIAAFDLSGACSGFINALAVGTQFIRTGACRHVLVVGSEVMSRTLDFTDRTSCVLFGDGAGAAVLSPSDAPGRGIRALRMHSDGARGDLIRMPSNVSTWSFPDFLMFDPVATEAEPLRHLQLNGRQVYLFAVETMGRVIREALQSAELTPDDIKLVVPHQVNQRIIDSALKEQLISPEKIMINLDRYGNTAAASVPLALDEAIRSGRAQKGDTILLVAFGGGLSWASAVVTI